MNIKKTNFEKRGDEIRSHAKELVLDFMHSSPYCSPEGEGFKSAQIFRDCGFDWGEKENSSSSQQQYWIVALLRELESEGKIERVAKSGPWRLL